MSNMSYCRLDAGIMLAAVVNSYWQTPLERLRPQSSSNHPLEK